MEEYNQDDIDQLISCPKTILEPPKRELKLVGADWRNDMVLAASSDDLKGRFPVFILLRFNGPTEKTSRYASFEEALPFFLAAINVASSDIEKHFPQSRQAGLFGEHYE